MYDLMGKTILITGASSGIGEAMARQFAREGARLLLCARRLERLQALADELRASHDSDIHTFALDVRDRDAVEALPGCLPENFQEIDVLVNNAGLSRGLEPVHQGDPDDWDEMIRTNITGLLLMTRQILPGMVQRRRGDVVNLGSISSHEVYPNGAVYCATKHAVDALTHGLRLDLVASPVRVSQISPGMVDTEFSLVRFHGERERAESVYAGLHPLQAQDVAEAALFILTRPPHVEIGEIVLWPTAQASTTLVHRRSAAEESTPPNESTWRNFYELKD
jgi:serine 3-dehydrogenase